MFFFPTNRPKDQSQYLSPAPVAREEALSLSPHTRTTCPAWRTASCTGAAVGQLNHHLLQLGSRPASILHVLLVHWGCSPILHTSSRPNLRKKDIAEPVLLVSDKKTADTESKATLHYSSGYQRHIMSWQYFGPAVTTDSWGVSGKKTGINIH